MPSPDSNRLKVSHLNGRERNVVMALTECRRAIPGPAINAVATPGPAILTVNTTNGATSDSNSSASTDSIVPAPPRIPTRPPTLMKLIVRMEFKERKSSGTSANMSGSFELFDAQTDGTPLMIFKDITNLTKLLL